MPMPLLILRMVCSGPPFIHPSRSDRVTGNSRKQGTTSTMVSSAKIAALSDTNPPPEATTSDRLSNHQKKTRLVPDHRLISTCRMPRCSSHFDIITKRALTAKVR